MLDGFLLSSSVETQSVTEFMNLQVGLYPEYTSKNYKTFYWIDMARMVLC